MSPLSSPRGQASPRDEPYVGHARACESPRKPCRGFLGRLETAQSGRSFGALRLQTFPCVHRCACANCVDVESSPYYNSSRAQRRYSTKNVADFFGWSPQTAAVPTRLIGSSLAHSSSADPITIAVQALRLMQKRRYCWRYSIRCVVDLIEG